MVHIKHKIRGAPKIEMRGEPRYRARKGIRRVARKTPGSKTIIHYEKKVYGTPICAICKKNLHGVKRGTSIAMSKLTRTDLTVQRPFGANLCSPCSREILRWRARLKHNFVKENEIPLAIKQYIKV